MTRVVDRLVARGLRPPVAVARGMVGPAIVDLEPSIDRAHEVAGAPSARPRRIPPDIEAAPPRPERASMVAPTAAAAIAADVADLTADAVFVEDNPPAQHERVEHDEPDDRPDVRRTHPPQWISAPPASMSETPAVIRHEARAVEAVPGDGTVDLADLADVPHQPGRTEGVHPTVPANPVAARLETAAADRTQPDRTQPEPIAVSEPSDPPRAERPVAQARPRPVSPHRPALRQSAAPTRHAPPVGPPPTPSVTIGTIEVVTPPAASAAPRPLDALAARRRIGRSRWTGRVR